MASHEVRALPPPVGRSFPALVGAASVGFFFLATEAQSLLENLIAMAAAAAMFAGIAWNRPQPRFAWTLLALGTLMLAGGDILYGVSQPVPSPADMLYISAYPLLALGLIGLSRTIIPGRHASTMVDAALITLGVGIAAIVFLLLSPTDAGSAGRIGRLVALGYPVMDLGLLAVLIRPARADTARRGAFALLAAGLVLRLVADMIYVSSDFGSTYAVGDPADILWLLSYACFGAALLHGCHAAGRAPISPSRPAPAELGIEDQIGLVLSQLSQAPPQQRAPSSMGSRSLRFRVVLGWAGAALMILSAAALGLALTWHAGNLVLVAGAYGGTGSLILFTSRIAS